MHQKCSGRFEKKKNGFTQFFCGVPSTDKGEILFVVELCQGDVGSMAQLFSAGVYFSRGNHIPTIITLLQLPSRTNFIHNFMYGNIIFGGKGPFRQNGASIILG